MKTFGMHKGGAILPLGLVLAASVMFLASNRASMPARI